MLWSLLVMVMWHLVPTALLLFLLLTELLLLLLLLLTWEYLCSLGLRMYLTWSSSRESREDSSLVSRRLLQLSLEAGGWRPDLWRPDIWRSDLEADIWRSEEIWLELEETLPGLLRPWPWPSSPWSPLLPSLP